MEEFVDDASFDCWLQASDTLVLPYTSISSSGVGTRAALYGKQIVISPLPSLIENFPEAHAFQKAEDLSGLLRKLAQKLI